MSVTDLQLFRLTRDDARPFCPLCWDTSVVLTAEGKFERCERCVRASVDFSPEATTLAACLWRRVEKKQYVDHKIFAFARALVHATRETTVSRSTLMSLLSASERDVKNYARTLRSEWVLPVGSSRQKPSGYFWIRTAEEFFEWSRAFRNQALDQLVTEHRLRQLFPALAGQSSFDFVSDLQRQIEEALV